MMAERRAIFSHRKPDPAEDSSHLPQIGSRKEFSEGKGRMQQRNNGGVASGTGHYHSGFS